MSKIDVSAAKGWKPTPRGTGNSSGLLGFCGYVHLGRPEKVEAKKGDNNKYLEFTYFPQDDDCNGVKIVDRTTITGTMKRGDNAGTPNITMLFEQLHKAGMSQAEINSKIGSKGGMDEATLAKACAKRDYYAFVGVEEYKRQWRSDVKFYVTKDDYEDAIANDTARESLPPEAQEFYDRKAAGGGFRTTESADAGDVEDDDDF